MAPKLEATSVHDLNDLRRSAAGQEKFRRYLALIDLQPGESVLDLGCGSGEFSRLLATAVGPNGQITGIDHSEDALRTAKRFSAKNPAATINYEQGDAHDVAYGPATFDAAACISMLTFSRDPGQVVSELHRVLRPDGRLLLANSDEDSRFFNNQDRALGRRIMRAFADRGCEPWTGRMLAYWLTQADFSIVEEVVRTETEREYRAGKTGYVLANSMRDYLVKQAGIAEGEYECWLRELKLADQEGSYCYGVTGYAYLATKAA